jgi:hypothetical protein
MWPKDMAIQEEVGVDVGIKPVKQQEKIVDMLEI